MAFADLGPDFFSAVRQIFYQPVFENIRDCAVQSYDAHARSDLKSSSFGKYLPLDRLNNCFIDSATLPSPLILTPKRLSFTFSPWHSQIWAQTFSARSGRFFTSQSLKISPIAPFSRTMVMPAQI